jgi:hypothetical protein
MSPKKTAPANRQGRRCQPNLMTNYLHTFIDHRPERLSVSRVIYLDRTIARRSAVAHRQIKLEPESVMADVCLGVTVTGLYTLVGMGLIIAFM